MKDYPRVSYKKLAKYPTVLVKGEMMMKIRSWFEENQLSVICPPVFDEFVIAYTSKVCMNVPEREPRNMPAKGATVSKTKPEGIAVMQSPFPPTLEPHIWLILEFESRILVRYNPEKTGFRASLYENEKLTIDLVFDFNEVDIATNTYPVSATFLGEGDPQDVRSLENIIQNVAAVQSYLFYHKPEEITPSPAEDYTPTAENNHEPTEKKPAIQKKSANTIYPPRRRTLTISTSDELPRRKYNYTKLIWQVRGHYQRYGKAKTLKYVAPHLARRTGFSEETTDPSTYVITQAVENKPEILEEYPPNP